MEKQYAFLKISFFCILLSALPVNAGEGLLLEKVYKLDSELTAGVCPEELKRVRRVSPQEFGCDRVRLEYGYRSKELVQCKLRTDLANEIIYEYNQFIDACKNKPE